MADSVANIKLTGDKEIIARLKALPAKVQKKVLRPAVTAASRPVRIAAKRNAPVGQGFLKKAIDLKVKTYRRNVLGMIGPRSDMTFPTKNLWGKPINAKPAWYAVMQNDGVKPHQIMVGKGKKVAWQHPGTVGTKFMEKAYESTKASALSTMNKKLMEGIMKQA